MNKNIKKLILISFSVIGFGENEKEYIQSIPGTNEKVEMVYIPGGTFFMGSPKSEQGHFGDEGPQHQVEIAPFWMGKFEVTWDLYDLFVTRDIDGKRPQ